MQRIARWLKHLIIGLVGLVILLLIGGQMGLLSGDRPADLGATNGALREVDDKRLNSVSSQTRHDSNRVEPFATGDDPQGAFQALIDIAAKMPGATVVTREANYAHVEFQTRWFRFVDDAEFLLDEPGQKIHLRSAARIGRKDFDVNRKRIDMIRQQFHSAIGGQAAATVKPGAAGAPKPVAAGEQHMEFQTQASGLQIADIETGDGTLAEAGKQVAVHYTGWLYEDNQAGTEFDSSHKRGEPIRFPLGSGHVIQGWDEGVSGMKVGGMRRLIIPPELGYGARGAGGVIPPNATLLFEVQLMDVQ